MNWKRLFYFDLRRLVPGTKAPETEDDRVPELWFFKMFELAAGRRRMRRVRSARLDYQDYTPGRYYRMTGKRWPGPSYWRSRAWRRDLSSVMGQLTVIVKTNASLTKGLEACAREENRLNTQMNPRRLLAMSKAGLAAGLVVMVGIVWLIEILEQADALAFLTFVSIAGVGLLPAMIILRCSGRVEAVLLTLRDALAAGLSLSEAMRRQHRFFPQFYADMVAAGETSGCLAECLEQLGEDTLRRITLNRSLRHHFLYLGTVFVIQMSLLSFIFIKVMPVFAEIFEEFGGRLPAPARLGLGVKDTLGQLSGFEALMLSVFVPLALLLVAKLLFRPWRRRLPTRPVGAVLLLIPGLRGIVIKWNLATVALVLEKLLAAGVPMDRALESAAGVDLHTLYAGAVRRVRKRVLQGETLSTAFDREAKLLTVPQSFRSLIALGEQSGMLPEACGRIARFYQGQVDKRMRILADAVLPLGVLLLGYVTLMAELGLFLTLTGMIDAIMDQM